MKKKLENLNSAPQIALFHFKFNFFFTKIFILYLGMDLYFKRHDGSAVTCDEFCRAMGDANDTDLTQFLSSWYCQYGTPTVKVTHDFDAASQKYTMTFEQSGADDSQNPFIIPVRVALFNASNGSTIPLRVAKDDGPVQDRDEETTLCLTNKKHVFTFHAVSSGQSTDSAKRTKSDTMPIASIFRDFSAPVKVVFEQQTDDDLRFLLSNDTDPFNRWDSAQSLLVRALVVRAEKPAPLEADVIDALKKTLVDENVDAKLRAMVLTLPTETTLADAMDTINPVKIHDARGAAVKDVADALHTDFLAMYKKLAQIPFDADHPTKGSAQRALKNCCLSYLCKNRDDAKRKHGLELAFSQFKAAKNMTDQFSSLSVIVNSTDVTMREEALASFYMQWKHEELVVIKFFRVQAASQFGDSRGDALEVIRHLLKHHDFDIKVPAKAGAVLNVMATFNIAFHAADGSGYKLLADKILEADQFNGHTSARMCKQLQHWKRFAEPFSGLMKKELERVSASAKTNDLKEVAAIGLK